MTPRQRAGAVIKRRSGRERLQAWARHHRLSAAQSLRRILQHPYSTVLTWLVIGVALALPTGLLLGLNASQVIARQWESPGQVSAFLSAEMTFEKAQILQRELASEIAVAEVQLITPQQALAEFSETAGLRDVLAGLERNPFPHVLVLVPRHAADGVLLRDTLAAMPDVQEVVLDLEWLQRLQQILALASRLVWILAGLLAAGVLLALASTLRLAIENRREEIIVIKLVGGSDAFVRRPFLYTGLWYGLGGAVVALGIVVAVLHALKAPIDALIGSYGGAFTLPALLPWQLGSLLLCGALMGLVGAALAVRRHIVAMQPR